MIAISQDFFETNRHPMLVFDPLTKEVLSVNAQMSEFFECAARDILCRNVDAVFNAHFGCVDWQDEAAHFGVEFRMSDATAANQPAKLVTVYPSAETAGWHHADKRPKTASQPGKIGHWEVNCATGKMTCSRAYLEVFSVGTSETQSDCGKFKALVHPDDRRAFDLRIERSLTARVPYASLHRIIRGDGEVRYVREEGTVTGAPGAQMLCGITEDITKLYRAQLATERSAVLMSDADVIAKVGGWEYDAQTGIITRSAMVAQIHDAPDCMQISLADARQYYEPEYTERHERVWSDCLKTGKPFDEVMELITVKGARKWVRFVGSAVWNHNQTKVESIRGALQDVSDIVFARQRAEALSTTLEETLEGISDSFMTVDRDWCVTFANKSAARLMGVSQQEMINHHLWDLFPNVLGGTFHTHYETAMRTGETQRFTAQSKRSGRWLSVNAYATSHGLAIAARDVTEQHARDEQMQLLEAAVSRLNDIVIITSAEPIGDLPANHLVFVNEAFEATTGYKSATVLGQTIEFLHGPETLAEHVACIEEAIQKKRPVRVEILNYTKAGKPIWLDLDVLPIKKDDGTVTHWVSVSRDITERKEHEKRIHLNEERFRLVAAASNDVIWDCDLRSGKMWWNDKLLKVFGHDADKFDNRLKWWDANLHPADQESVLRKMQSIVDGSETIWELGYRFRRADGSYAQVHDKGSVLRDENGIATRILGTMTDISERLDLEEQLRQSQKMEAIGKLTGGVAHDFNNLLAIILGNLELLKEEMLSGQLLLEDACELIDSGISAVRRGSDLTGHMLAYARKARLAPEETDLNEVVGETVSWMRRTIDSKIRIETDLTAPLWQTRVDRNLLQNAIVNLILNALDAVSAGGRITIETRNVIAGDRQFDASNLPASPNGYVLLRISDDGPGIDAPNLEQVFDPFFTTKPVGQGSGLGLSMVHGFVSQSGGEIKMFSEPGKGTRLELFFKPFVPDTSRQAALGRSSAPSDQFDQDAMEGRILVVEDEPAVRRMLERTLVNAGFDVVIAQDGDTALECFEHDQDFDLLLTDVSMPGTLQGFDLAQACRQISAHIPIIFLSGHATENLPAYDAMSPEALRLMKPLSREDLLKAVNGKIKNPRSKIQSTAPRADAL